jgi:hypothetical protein
MSGNYFYKKNNSRKTRYSKMEPAKTTVVEFVATLNDHYPISNLSYGGTCMFQEFPDQIFMRVKTSQPTTQIIKTQPYDSGKNMIKMINLQTSEIICKEFCNPCIPVKIKILVAKI